MKNIYIVTEGKTDAEILKKLLPRKFIKQIDFVAGSGSYSAQSLASTLLAIRRQPLAFVFDTGTQDQGLIQEKISFLRELLGKSSSGVAFQVFPAIPEIETVFFQDKKFIKQLANKTLSDAEWDFAKLHPKHALVNLLDKPAIIDKVILDKLTPEAVINLQKHPLIIQLNKFVSAVIANGGST